MKIILYYLSIVALLSSCLSEKNADPGKPNTFVRYFNGGNDDYAKVAEETSDGGIIILGTTEISDKTDLSAKTYKIKLIETDEYGNVIWQTIHPDFTSVQSFKGHSLLQLPKGGFMVIGESVLTGGKTDMYILEVDANGVIVNEKTIDFGITVVANSLSIQGKAIQLSTTDKKKIDEGNYNYLVLGAIPGAADNMVLAELDKSDLSVKWVKKYGAGTSSLSNKIYLDAFNNVFWSGTVTRSSSDIRLVKTAQNSLSTIFDLPIGKPDFQEEGIDICRYGFGFAVVGNTNESIAGGQDILFKILAEDGSELLSKSFGFGDTDTGNSVTSTRGGIVILGTSLAVPLDSGGRGEEDYYLMKFDAFGKRVWPKPRVFGSKNRDLGASVRQLTDGSLLVLGTTDFGGVKTMMLMKADSEGNIE